MRVPSCVILFLIILLSSCATSKPPLSKNSWLTLISEYRLSNELSYQNSRVGGLSGIDYNAKKDEYYLISDDRSATGAARFYTVKIILGEQKIDSVRFTGVSYLHNSSQQLYPPFTQDSLHSCDPEGIRFNPFKNEWTWCSEGERYVTRQTSNLQDPWVYNMTIAGKFRDSFLIPPNIKVNAHEKGPRRNSSFEGLSYGYKGRSLFVSLEEPIYEDGPRAATADSTAWTRILRFSTKTKKIRAQYAYLLDPVHAVPIPPGAFKINGISDVLVVDKYRILVVERSFSTGNRENGVKVFLAEFRKSTDVGDKPLSKERFKGLEKKLLLDMTTLGIHIDNIEGVCFGPRLANGKLSLLFISDNNFNKDQVTQLLLFQID